MKNKVFALILAAILSLVSWGAIAESDPLRALADSAVPDGAMYLAMEKDDGATEYKYWLPASQETMNVKVIDDRILRIELDAWQDEGSLNVTLTETDVKNIIRTVYPDADIISVVLHKDDGLSAYKARFTTQSFHGEIKLHPESGKVLELNQDFEAMRLEKTASASKSQTSASSGSKSTQTAGDGLIGTARAREIALKKAGGGTVSYIKLDREDGYQVYEGEIVNGDYEYEFEIDAKSGSIREWDKDRRDDD